MTLKVSFFMEELGVIRSIVTIEDKQNLVKELKEFLELYQQSKYWYMWKPPTSSYARKAYEIKNSKTLKFQYNNVLYRFVITCECSCIHIYKLQSIHINNEKKNILAVKKLLKELELELELGVK